ncbi:MAG: PASTA domain-containing protein [Clostridia bacterium]|nr:PASTA domain-containing protein [Clostridia bacterium]
MASNKNALCVNCMKPFDPTVTGDGVCPHCGFDNKVSQNPSALAFRSYLRKRYISGRVRAANSEGITYTALDVSSGRRVDLREFFPQELVKREGKKVIPKDGCEDLYNDLMVEYTQMARALAKIRSNHALFMLIDVFKDNNTVYLVYEHHSSETLHSYISKNGPLTWNEAKELFMPMMSSLSAMHSAGVMHLGISPDTLRICSDGKMRLSDFCIPAVRQADEEIKPDLIPGCAAYEQYVRIFDCAETTDVYGFAASMVYALTGRLPADAVSRSKDPKLLLPKNVLRALPGNVVRALAGALQVRQENRTGSFERFKAELIDSTRQLSEMSETSAIRELPRTNQYTPQRRRGLPTKFWLVFSFVFSLVVMGVASYFLVNNYDINGKINGYVKKIEEQTAVSSVETISVPNMIGGVYADWLIDVNNTGTYDFNLSVSGEEFSDEVGEGRIISTDPAPGSRITRGESVTAVISKGSVIRSLPSLKGYKFSDALNKLESMGFIVEKVEEYSDTVASGMVLYYTDYESGTELEYGSSVRVSVSIGKYVE